MNEIHLLPKNSVVRDVPGPDPDPDRAPDKPPQRTDRPSRSRGRWLFGAAALLLLAGGLGVGGWRHAQAQLALDATTERTRDFVPTVRVSAVRASHGVST